MSRWYIIHAYSGFENKVKDSILAEATRMGLEPQVEAVEVPTEKVTEVRRGKKVQSERKFFPGYVLAKLAMSDQVYHLVKNTPKVTGFLGPNGKPQAISEAEAARMGLEPQVEAVEVPTEKVTEVRRGKKVQSERKFFPGYVLAKLSMSDQVYHLVKNTPKVTGFLGPNGKPQAISEAEAARILSTKEEMAAAAPSKKIHVDYDIGDQVKVLDGPFASFNGVVEELDFDRGRVKVSVSIFGRATPVELEFEQVERVK
jgi:transcriptional antiterminator NusG